jgi:hypothetical protein
MFRRRVRFWCSSASPALRPGVEHHRDHVRLLLRLCPMVITIIITHCHRRHHTMICSSSTLLASSGSTLTRLGCGRWHTWGPPSRAPACDVARYSLLAAMVVVVTHRARSGSVCCSMPYRVCRICRGCFLSFQPPDRGPRGSGHAAAVIVGGAAPPEYVRCGFAVTPSRLWSWTRGCMAAAMEDETASRYSVQDVPSAAVAVSESICGMRWLATLRPSQSLTLSAPRAHVRVRCVVCAWGRLHALWSVASTA